MPNSASGATTTHTRLTRASAFAPRGKTWAMNDHAPQPDPLASPASTRRSTPRAVARVGPNGPDAGVRGSNRLRIGLGGHRLPERRRRDPQAEQPDQPEQARRSQV